MQVIDELQKLGFTLTIDQDDLVIRYIGAGHPDPAHVKPLLDDLRAHKRKAIIFLVFQPVNDELAALWRPGTREYIEANLPELAQEIDQAEAQLNAAWLAVNDGTGDLDGFSVALENWRQANLKAIKAY